MGPLKPTLLGLLKSQAFSLPSISGVSFGKLRFKHVNVQSLQFVNKGTHIDLDVNGLSVSVDRIDVTVRKTIEKFGASFDVKCDGWIEGGIKSTDINSHLYFGKGPVVAIRNSNVNFGDLHLDFHMNGICSVANGIITKSFVSTKLKDVAQSFLNSQLGKMEDAISNKINGIPKIKSILSYCGRVMDVVNALTNDNDEEEEEEHASPAVQSTEESAASYQEEEHTSPAVHSIEESAQDEIESRHGCSNTPKEIAEAVT